MAVRLASALALILLAGCGRAHLYYDTRELRHLPLQRAQEQALNQTLVDELEGRSVTWVSVDGRQREIAANDVRALGVAERVALWLVLSTGEVGGEHDVRVRTSAGRGKEARTTVSSTPVTVYLALDGSVRVVSARQERDEEPAPELHEIRRRFRLAGKTPGTWGEPERRALAGALASMDPRELDVVTHLDFDREVQPRDRDRSRAAIYEMRGCRAQITLYSSGVRADAFRFVGPTTAPRSAVLHAIVHELGHAFEQAPARTNYCAADSARGERRNELVRAGNELTSDSPIMRAYLRALDGDPAPTDYGNASAHESFAESFALFHIDPDALRRARPKVFAWFADGGHIAAAR